MNPDLQAIKHSTISSALCYAKEVKLKVTVESIQFNCSIGGNRGRTKTIFGKGVKKGIDYVISDWVCLVQVDSFADMKYQFRQE